MTEGEAQQLLCDSLAVSGATLDKLCRFTEMVIAENRHQNLISASTIPHIWQRHILDSAQLIKFLPEAGCWIDLGSGPGFPGIVLALLRPNPIIFVESRRKRFSFLHEAVTEFGLSHVQIHGGALETLESTTVSAITARAFAPLPKLFACAHRFSIDETIWVLPKGMRAHEEVAAARDSWGGMFHVEHSMSDAEGRIVVASRIQPRELR